LAFPFDKRLICIAIATSWPAARGSKAGAISGFGAGSGGAGGFVGIAALPIQLQ
jgi:hypothetical protein